jgi:AraC-like DNA-binding protein
MAREKPVIDLDFGWVVAWFAAGTGSDHVALCLFTDVYDGDDRLARLRHTDFYSLYIVDRGSGLHVIDGVPYAVARGDVYVMGLGSEHTYEHTKTLRVHAIHFTADAFDRDAWAALRRMPGFDRLVVDQPSGWRLHLDPSTFAEVARELAELQRAWRTGTVIDAHLARASFLRLLVRLTRVAAGGQHRPSLRRHSPTTQQHRDDALAAAVQTIDLHYDRPLRVSDLAASAYLSHDRFTELFKSAMGRVPQDYIRHVRVERAKLLLTTTELPTAHIARATGFKDRSYFARVFRRATSMSPGEFRRNAQAL